MVVRRDGKMEQKQPETQRQKWARYMRTWRHKDPVRTKRLRKIQYNNRKRKAMEMVGGVKCKRCGCDEIDYLEYNHTNGGGCKEWRSVGFMSMTDRILTGKRSTKGLEILCRVCNALEFLERKNGKQSKRYKIIWK